MRRQEIAVTVHDGLPSYARREILADAALHSLGISLGLGACATLAALAWAGPAGRAAALLVYGLSLQTMLVCSALFNLAPISPRKRLLRRLDHAAIYLLIAGTYTPFAHRLIEAGSGLGLLVAVWILALAGMAAKLSGLRFGEPWSSLSYVVLGWIGVLALGPLLATVSPVAMRWLLAGGLLYTAGVPIHLARGVPFHNAIWHGFVLAGAACHFTATMHEFR